MDKRGEWVTSVECISADGCVLPPMVIMKAKGPFKGLWRPPGVDDRDWIWATSPSGWTHDGLGYQWLSEIFIPWVRGRLQTSNRPLNCSDRVLLIVDGHGSHCRARFVALCMKENIDLVILPPHTSNVTQPLDLTVFAGLKSNMTTETDRMNLRKLSTISKTDFAHGLTRARLGSFLPRTIVKGFRKSGIWPYNAKVCIDAAQKKVVEAEDGAVLQRTPLGSLKKENSDLIDNSATDISTPIKDRIYDLTDALEDCSAKRVLLKKELEQYRAREEAKKPARAGNTVAYIGSHVFSAPDTFDRLAAHEWSQKVKKRPRNDENLDPGPSRPSAPVSELLN